jgi:hypothetical protein
VDNILVSDLLGRAGQRLPSGEEAGDGGQMGGARMGGARMSCLWRWRMGAGGVGRRAGEAMGGGMSGLGDYGSDRGREINRRN